MSIFKKILVFAAVVACSASVHAAGFTILEQTSAGLGRALAGIAADTENPGAIFFNPSLSAWYDRPALTVGNTLLHVNAYMRRMGSNTAQGGQAGNGGGNTLIPHIYYVHPFGNGLALGLGFSATSGTATRWNPHWAGRSLGVNTEIAVMEFAPTLSYKVNDQFSFGGGLAFEYARARMTRTPMALGYQKLSFRGDSRAVGFTMGLTYEPVKGTKLGLGYRSRMKHDLSMRYRINALGFKGRAETNLDMPAMFDFGVTHVLNEKWTAMGSITWTRSHDMKNMKVKFKSGQLAALAGEENTPMKWRNSWKLALGAEYKWTEKFTVRFGAAYDQTPIRAKEYRYPLLPDCSRVWLSVGGSYAFTPNCSLDCGYTRLTFISSHSYLRLENNTHLSTRVGGNCDLYSAALTFRF